MAGACSDITYAEPLEGIRMALTRASAARRAVDDYVKIAREEGRTWAQVGQALGLAETAADRDVPLAEAAFEYVVLVREDSFRFDTPSFGWHCRGFRLPETVRTLLEERAVIIRLGIISGRERNALRSEDAYAALRPVLDTGDGLLMGRLMVVLDQIQRILALSHTEESTDQVTLLRVITDWYRIAMPTLLTRRVLKDQYTAYRREIAGNDHLNTSVTRFERVLTWAIARPSCERPQLVDLEEVGRRARYIPHPLLAVVAEDTDQEGSWPVASAAWAYATCQRPARVLSRADIAGDQHCWQKGRL